MIGGFTEVRDEVLAHRREGLSVRAIAARMGWGQDAVRGILRAAGMSSNLAVGDPPVIVGRRRDWRDDELAAIAGATSRQDAIRRYRARFGPDARSDNGITGQYYRDGGRHRAR